MQSTEVCSNRIRALSPRIHTVLFKYCEIQSHDRQQNPNFTTTVSKTSQMRIYAILGENGGSTTLWVEFSVPFVLVLLILHLTEIKVILSYWTLWSFRLKRTWLFFKNCSWSSATSRYFWLINIQYSRLKSFLGILSHTSQWYEDVFHHLRLVPLIRRSFRWAMNPTSTSHVIDMLMIIQISQTNRSLCSSLPSSTFTSSY